MSKEKDLSPAAYAGQSFGKAVAATSDCDCCMALNQTNTERANGTDAEGKAPCAEVFAGGVNVTVREAVERFFRRYSGEEDVKR